QVADLFTDPEPHHGWGAVAVRVVRCAHHVLEGVLERVAGLGGAPDRGGRVVVVEQGDQLADGRDVVAVHGESPLVFGGWWSGAAPPPTGAGSVGGGAQGGGGGASDGAGGGGGVGQPVHGRPIQRPVGGASGQPQHRASVGAQPV